jgi:hypothetical protein
VKLLAGAEDWTSRRGEERVRTVEYSETFKRKMVQRMFGPKGKSATELGKEVNVHQVTLAVEARGVYSGEYGTVQPSDTNDQAPAHASGQDSTDLAAGSDTAEEGARLRREGSTRRS